MLVIRHEGDETVNGILKCTSVHRYVMIVDSLGNTLPNGTGRVGWLSNGSTLTIRV